MKVGGHSQNRDARGGTGVFDQESHSVTRGGYHKRYHVMERRIGGSLSLPITKQDHACKYVVSLSLRSQINVFYQNILLFLLILHGIRHSRLFNKPART